MESRLRHLKNIFSGIFTMIGGILAETFIADCLSRSFIKKIGGTWP
jgi:hypothetical protein